MGQEDRLKMNDNVDDPFFFFFVVDLRMDQYMYVPHTIQMEKGCMHGVRKK